MAGYEPFGELLDGRPVLVIREGLRHCASVIELAAKAREKGFDVQVSYGGFVNDIIVRGGEGAPQQNHTVRSARRLIERY
jgi:hypothetical protein